MESQTINAGFEKMQWKFFTLKIQKTQIVQRA